MRKRLIEILKAFRAPICEGLNFKLPDVEAIADYLLANGIIVPPCKVEESLSKAHIQAHYEAIYALADMVYQFGYSTTFRRQDAVCNGGLSALEYAFGALEDCGCKMNSNGTISLKNLEDFQEKIRAKMEGANNEQAD